MFGPDEDEMLLQIYFIIFRDATSSAAAEQLVYKRLLLTSASPCVLEKHKDSSICVAFTLDLSLFALSFGEQTHVRSSRDLTAGEKGSCSHRQRLFGTR